MSLNLFNLFHVLKYIDKHDILYILATEYQKFFTFVLVQIAQRLQVGGTTNRGVKFILTNIQRYLLYVIKKRGIELFFYIDNVTGQVIIISTVCGITCGITGAFFAVWVGVTTTTVGHFLVAVFVGRIFVQQFQHFRDVQNERKKIVAFAEKSEEFLRKQEDTFLNSKS